MHLSLALDPSSPALARAQMRDWAARSGLARVSESLELLVSELVTNAVMHSDAPAGSDIGVAAGLVGQKVHVAVTDRGSVFEPRRSPPDRSGGFGFYLLDLEADRWGVDRGEATRVWFEL